MAIRASRVVLGLAVLGLAAWLARGGTFRERHAPPLMTPIFVLLLDATRFDRLATYDPAMPLGTSIDHFAREAIVFERAYSTSSWTRTAVASLLSGRSAEAHGVLGRGDVLPDGIETLATMLRSRGYRTHAFSSNPNILPQWGFGRGFDTFADVGAQAWPARKADATEVFAAVRESIDAAADGRPALYYIHLMDTHAPYLPNPEDAAAVRGDARLAGTFPGRPPAPNVVTDYFDYLGELVGMDREIGAFFDDLRSRGLYERSMVLVVADHGEEFLDHGTTRHGKTLYEEVLRVPMILKLPGGAHGGARVRGSVGSVDLLPTMLTVLGVEVPADLDGRTRIGAGGVLAEGDDPALTARLRIDEYDKAAIVQDRRKLIVDHGGREQLFDLGTDPHESLDLFDERPDEARALRAILDRPVRTPAVRATTDTEVDPSLRERLRALGYQW